jgi:hypothetical protein
VERSTDNRKVKGSTPFRPMSILSLYLGPVHNSIWIGHFVCSRRKDPMAAFMYGLRAPDTRRQYPRRFQYFLNFLTILGTLEEQAKQFTLKARENPLWAQESLMSFIDFQKERVKKGELAESTITNYYKATKLFCVMNDIVLNWKKISRGLPAERRAANDRAPTIEEVKKIVEYPDRRIKPIVYTMASSGIRIGAWDYLQWKHVKPISNDEGAIIAAKLMVYFW